VFVVKQQTFHTNFRPDSGNLLTKLSNRGKISICRSSYDYDAFANSIKKYAKRKGEKL
jgi:hypothetical protein